MSSFTYGPVEMYLVGLEGERPDPGVIDAFSDLLEGGLIRLLDFILVSRTLEGEVVVTEVEDVTDEYGFGDVELAAVGITGDEDVAEMAALIEPGRAAAIVVVELVWAKRLAERMSAAGGVVLSSERIPAPIVNALVDTASAG
ncbi:DUF6325 family protein [Microbacterium sp. LRZ72]|uniref:DUF6325 family protein n=1 Tax=Microbacterium sp. LRZ72 TaxID=2942481 RepID=UPI0029B93244|nr:DUF6325 family protein [Microbacterium sp. LRZ72]MDX2375615.1 DUF6325 family protein [Microbacterium sp. LRZ72]